MRPSAHENRLDVFLSKHVKDYSRSYIASLCDKGNVLVDGKQQRKNYKVFPGQTVQLRLDPVVEVLRAHVLFSMQNQQQ